MLSCTNASALKKTQNENVKLSVCCGDESALTAGGNNSYSTVSAVIISSYFVSGSFHHWAGRLEGALSLLDTIELHV